MNIWRHFKTITYHRWLVRQGCFQVGLYWQGLIHDLSKYSPTEFWVGVKYFQGDSSPNGAERKAKGYSEAWMHHKGRNRHHYEYWTDMSPVTKQYESVPMPRKYLVEMVMDRRAACKVYQKDAYHSGSELEYFLPSRERQLMHPQTKRELEYILTMLMEQGEEKTFRYIKTHVLAGLPFPWQQQSGEEN
ncbi:MAG: catalase [Oscillospiraceae bacterium]|nr:catalase [Oscillospiraceae bacterium]